MLLSIALAANVSSLTFSSEADLATFLHGEYEKSATSLCIKENQAEWAYDIDVNNEHVQQQLVMPIGMKSVLELHHNQISGSSGLGSSHDRKDLLG